LWIGDGNQEGNGFPENVAQLKPIFHALACSADKDEFVINILNDFSHAELIWGLWGVPKLCTSSSHRPAKPIISNIA
jgi:hypothetical protein